MDKQTEWAIEDRITEALYLVMTSQTFHDFYTSKSKKSLTAHIEGRDSCPTKGDVKKELSRVFNPVINSVIDYVKNRSF